MDINDFLFGYPSSKIVYVKILIINKNFSQETLTRKYNRYTRYLRNQLCDNPWNFDMRRFHFALHI